MYGPFFHCEDYHFKVDWQGRPTDQRLLALLYATRCVRTSIY
jgi:hypothetical protein